jgi:hypothetical protein
MLKINIESCNLEYQTISLVHSNTLDLSSLGFHVPTLNESIIIYTTLKIVDSEGLQPPSMVNEARNTINLNIIQCAKSLVNQSGIVDTQSRKLNPSSLYPNIHKVYSQWDILSSVNSTPGDSTLIGGNSVCAINQIRWRRQDWQPQRVDMAVADKKGWIS